MKRRQAGFTLIEVTIVAVIVAILAAVAIPSYTRHVRSSDRAAAKSLMMQLAAREERYYTENNAYAALTTVGYAATLKTANNSHTITITPPNGGAVWTGATGYTITATPARTDPECGTLTLNNVGMWANSQSAAVTKC